jgi:NADH-quinone oxidoreductase subunit G
MTDAVKPNVETTLVNLTIDNVPVSVPKGTLVVDAAKKIGIDIPVFCYHPKLEPVGMCRMCLVDIGLPAVNRETGKVETDKQGHPVINFARTLQTGCTVEVAEGMVVVGYTEKVQKARRDVLEFLLTSHPLDCPICDKGGECPLQNLTMAHGSSDSRFIFDEKIKLAKHVPLGEMIFLDRERCIQCARCTRFQDEIADDPVIGFEARGRSLQIVTYSEPGFDSIWSGNTTDICPVGALTTADFRFGARPWELQASASICTHCPVGCNTTLNTRREAKAGGEMVVKRVMPRQNEEVNEIWLCDKGRFAHHYAAKDDDRLTQPLVRKDGKLVATTWDKALDLVAGKFAEAGNGLVALAGGKLSNEDFFNIAGLAKARGGKALLDSRMAGGDLTAQVGLSAGSNLADLGKGDAVLVVACDLEEEAPLWWLRVKQAAERGATVIVANPRRTKLERHAAFSLRYGYGHEAALVTALVGSFSPKRADLPAAVQALIRDRDVKDAGQAVAAADNLVVFYGSEGTGPVESAALARACANQHIATGHVGRPNNGLVAVWDKANAQGGWDMGLRPSADLTADLGAAKAAYIVASDPAGDSPTLAEAVKAAAFVVVQELRLSATAELADVVLPVAAFTERDGTFTSGERRVQRFYPAVPAYAGLRGDFAVTAKIAARLGVAQEETLATGVFNQIAASVPAYAGLNVAALSEVREQWPVIGRGDVYYGGTTYENSQGLGVQLPAAEGFPALTFDQPAEPAKFKGLKAVPVTRLYDRGTTVTPSTVLRPRLPGPFVVLSVEDADKLKIEPGQRVKTTLNSVTVEAEARIDNSLPKSVVLAPRSFGLPIDGPCEIAVSK